MQSSPGGPWREALNSPAALALLSSVWDHAPIARRDLSRLTSLAPSSVTRLAQRLASAGLIVESHHAPSTGGRPAKLFSLSDAVGVVIGIDLSGMDIRVAVMTPSGVKEAEASRPFEGMGGASLLTQLAELLEEFIAQAVRPGRRLLGIAISVPGTVDRGRGTVLDVSHLELHEVELGATLHRRFGVPVHLEHDTMAAAYAEKQYGVGRRLSHLIFVTVGGGVGAGFVLDDRIYRGEAGVAGELGHVVVEANGNLCVCGKRGCLEAVASAPALLRAARAAIESGTAKGLAERVGADPEGLSIAALAGAAAAGDEDARRLLRKEADYLARAIGAVASLLDIRTVVLGGEQALFGDFMLSCIDEALPGYKLYSNAVDVVRAELGQDAALRGASALAFRSIFGLKGLNGEARTSGQLRD